MGAASTEGSSTTHRQRTWLIQDKEVIVNVNDFDGSTKDGSLVPDDVHMMTISKRNVSQIVSSGCRRETVVVGFTGRESQGGGSQAVSLSHQMGGICVRTRGVGQRVTLPPRSLVK